MHDPAKRYTLAVVRQQCKRSLNRYGVTPVSVLRSLFAALREQLRKLFRIALDSCHLKLAQRRGIGNRRTGFDPFLLKQVQKARREFRNWRIFPPGS